jgi:RNA polymerase sigma-70 factor (ECF subfamily)
MGRSFEAVFEADFASLHRYLARRVGAAAADELAAETFAVAFRNWDRLDPERPVRPWLYGIAANLMRHHWRKERRMLRAYARNGVDPVFADEDAAVERADADARHRELATALAGLRRDEREILLLRAWVELTDSEIADALGLPIGTVKSRLSRARATSSGTSSARSGKNRWKPHDRRPPHRVPRRSPAPGRCVREACLRARRR